MESKLMFLVVCVIGCAVSCTMADRQLSTNLTSNITRNECGKTKLCLDNPKGCDPSGSSQCFFTSVQINFTTPSLMIELSGNSNGYIALAAGMTYNVTQGGNIIFVCGKNSTEFFFQTATFSNTLVTTNILNVNNIQGSIQPSLIQCAFSIPIDANIISLLNNVSGTNVNISNIDNSQMNVFLDILQGFANGTVLGESVLGSSVLVNLANVNSTGVVSPTASTNASTTASTNASTTASTTVGTTTSTTARTTTKTTANSASISLSSLLSHAAICLLSIFLHLM
ncbi:hypothetical protein Q8A67_008086 [Cirrhinus molitorella]|uniref:Ferric-chelate reductase 1 n=1 Tax=Cirrhinus molitorella TaxID=172907 RepID=A0AA88PW32_9TELE|nr:hypothetical protein Q8A67_008086 [Cirrhinus molitorella]